MRVQQGLGNKHPRPPTPHNHKLILHATCGFVTPISSKASKVPDQLAMVLPRFSRILRFDWLEGEFWSVRGRERDRWRS